MQGVGQFLVHRLQSVIPGHPFFTEQLVAAAAPGVLGVGVGLPARLAELLVTRLLPRPLRPGEMAA